VHGPCFVLTLWLTSGDAPLAFSKAIIFEIKKPGAKHRAFCWNYFSFTPAGRNVVCSRIWIGDRRLLEIRDHAPYLTEFLLKIALCLGGFRLHCVDVGGNCRDQVLLLTQSEICQTELLV
jgi:hypothetical protein